MMRFSFSIRETNKFDILKFHNISQSELVYNRTLKSNADRQTDTTLTK